MASFSLLREKERRLVYQRVFEEMGVLNGVAKERVKGVYYYVIRKIRGRMKGFYIGKRWMINRQCNRYWKCIGRSE